MISIIVTYWEGNTAVHRQTSKFLECAGDNSWIEVVERSSRGEAVLDLQLTNRKELVENMKVEARLGDSDHNVTEIKILWGERKEKSRIMTRRV